MTGRSRRTLPPALALLLAVLAGGCGAGSSGATPAASSTPLPQPTLALVGGTLIDGTGAAAVPDAVVVIGGDRIVAAGPRTTTPVPAGVTTIDVRGAAILPGFINAHVHGGHDLGRLQSWAEGGVTTVRDEGTSITKTANLRAFREQAAADPHNARLISAGVILAVPDGYGDRFFSGVDEARAAVLEERDQGVDAIKVALEDGYAGTTGLPKPSAEELRAIVETAHANGLPVSGHVTDAAYLQPMLDAGVDDVAHLPYGSIPDSAARQMAAQGVYVTPTFTVFRNYGAPTDAHAANLKQLLDAGVEVALGNDYLGGPGEFELGIPMFEIETMARAGMTPMQVIEACTRNAAHVVDREAELGTLEPGKFADVLVVAGNPLEDLQALRDVRLVVHGGAVIRDKLSG